MTKTQIIYRKCHKKCEECGSYYDLLVHHIDENRSNNEFDNFKVLCKSCQAIIHQRIINIHKMKHFYLTDPNQLTFSFFN